MGRDSPGEEDPPLPEDEVEFGSAYISTLFWLEGSRFRKMGRGWRRMRPDFICRTSERCTVTLVWLFLDGNMRKAIQRMNEFGGFFDLTA